jgi:phosphoribosylamine-glycine ligase
MNVLILSPISLSMFLVPRLNQEKDIEKIYFWTRDTTMKCAGKGMENVKDWEKFELVSDYNEVLNKHKPSDIIIFIDDIGMGHTGKHLRDLGYKVIGGGVFMDRLEDERQLATDLMKKVMDVPESTSFKSFDEGIRFVKNFEPDERLLFKPNDSDAPKEYTYLAKDVDDLVEAMQSFKAEWKYKEDFQIQKFIKGTEVDFSAYFNGKEYLTNSMVIYFENKPLMPGDIGPATGGAIAVEFCRKPDEIFWPILEKLKPVMIKDDYKGQVSINCIVSDEDKKPYFLEFCSRVGYPSLPLDVTLLEENKKSVWDLFKAIVNGENPDLFPTDKIAVTASIFVPPAPNGAAPQINESQGEPIDWDIKYDRYFFPYYIMWDEKMCLAGISSWVGQVTSVDSTIDGAIQTLYDTYMPTLRLKDKIYRNDLGDSAKERIKKLRDYKIL